MALKNKSGATQPGHAEGGYVRQSPPAVNRDDGAESAICANLLDRSRAGPYPKDEIGEKTP